MATVSLARAYQQSFSTHPNVTLAVTGGSLNAIADIVAQTAQNVTASKTHDKRQGYDPVRTLRFFAFGVALSPFLGRWNAFLERQFPLRSLQPGSSSKVSPIALAKRVLCDQIVMAPIGLAAFVGSMGLMEGRSSRQIKQKYSDMYAPTLITNWQVWPLAQLINFRYMPLPYRVPFQSGCGVFWTLYLSLVNSKEDQSQDRKTEMRNTLDR